MHIRPSVIAFSVSSPRDLSSWRPGISALLRAFTDRVVVAGIERRTGEPDPWPAIHPAHFRNRRRYEIGVHATDRKRRRLIRDACTRQRFDELVDGVATGATWRLTLSVTSPEVPGFDSWFDYATIALDGSGPGRVGSLSGFIGADLEDAATIDAVGAVIRRLTTEAAILMDATSGLVGYPRLSRHEWRRGISEEDGLEQSGGLLRGGGWLTFASPTVLEPLGGPDRVSAEAPVAAASRLEGGTVRLDLAASLTQVDAAAIDALDAYLAPVLVHRPAGDPLPLWGDGDPPETFDELHRLISSGPFPPLG